MGAARAAEATGELDVELEVVVSDDGAKSGRGGAGLAPPFSFPRLCFIFTSPDGGGSPAAIVSVWCCFATLCARGSAQSKKRKRKKGGKRNERRQKNEIGRRWSFYYFTPCSSSFISRIENFDIDLNPSRFPSCVVDFWLSLSSVHLSSLSRMLTLRGGQIKAPKLPREAATSITLKCSLRLYLTKKKKKNSTLTHLFFPFPTMYHFTANRIPTADCSRPPSSRRGFRYPYNNEEKQPKGNQNRKQNDPPSSPSA